MDSVVLQCQEEPRQSWNTPERPLTACHVQDTIELSFLKHTKMHVSPQHAVALAIYSLHDLLHSFTVDSILRDINLGWDVMQHNNHL